MAGRSKNMARTAESAGAKKKPTTTSKEKKPAKAKPCKTKKKAAPKPPAPTRASRRLKKQPASDPPLDPTSDSHCDSTSGSAPEAAKKKKQQQTKKQLPISTEKAAATSASAPEAAKKKKKKQQQTKKQLPVSTEKASGPDVTTGMIMPNEIPASTGCGDGTEKKKKGEVPHTVCPYPCCLSSNLARYVVNSKDINPDFIPRVDGANSAVNYHRDQFTKEGLGITNRNVYRALLRNIRQHFENELKPARSHLPNYRTHFDNIPDVIMEKLEKVGDKKEWSNLRELYNSAAEKFGAETV